MNRLTDNDKNFGPITLAKWRGTFSAYVNGKDDDGGESHLLLVAFGLAMRVKLPITIQPFGKYREHSRGFYCFHGEGKQWHRTKDAAVFWAEVMRSNKIASLEV